MRKVISMAIIIGLVLAPATVWAETSEQTFTPAEEFLQSLNLQNGIIELPNGIATIDVPDSFRYIGPGDSKRFLEEGWHNPDGSGQIGMLLPMQTDLFDDGGWAVVISYEEDGYVSDEDADKIDYDELLQSMKDSSKETNELRVQQGFEPVTLVDWASPPYYDNLSKKLYWAKELKFGDSPQHTLNYNVRILGRKGILVMNAVSSMDQLPLIREQMEQVIAFAEFNDGYRYSDFQPGVDKVAAYGIAALIGGKVAAKAGLLAKLGGLLVAFKKFLFIGIAMVVGFFAKLFKGRKSES